MRHSGDISDLCNFLKLKDQDRKRIRLGYCPTLISGGIGHDTSSSKKVGIQIASDRLDDRYSEPIKFFKSVHGTMIELEKRGYHIDIIDQCKDGVFIDWLKKTDRMKDSFNVTTLTDKPYSYQLEYYKTLNTIYATRGHGQMIPMGLGVNVVSMISHDKLKYFLEDVDLEKTGIEVGDVTASKLLEMFNIAQETDYFKEIKLVKSSIEAEVENIRKIIFSN
jgi:polysaccharide pyruvyl transferase WcaK-like protein